MMIALDKYTGHMLTSSPNCMMSSSVAMKTLCNTNIGSISLKKIAGVEMSDCNIFTENLQKYLKYTRKHSV